MKKLTGIIASVALLAGVTACSSNDASTADSPEITVTGQWARQSPMATTMGAAYMTIESSADDELIGASADASIAEKVEVHEMVPADSSDMESDGHSDMESDGHSDMESTNTSMPAMKMQEVGSIKVAPGMPIEMKPGGFHVMFIGLVNPLEIGQTIKVTLKFSKSGDKVIDVPVLEDAP